MYVGASWACATCAVPALLAHTDIQSQTAIAMGLPDRGIEPRRYPRHRQGPSERCAYDSHVGPSAARAFSASLALGAAATHFLLNRAHGEKCHASYFHARVDLGFPAFIFVHQRLSRRMKSRTSSRVKSYGQSCMSRYERVEFSVNECVIRRVCIPWTVAHFVENDEAFHGPDSAASAMEFSSQHTFVGSMSNASRIC